jgi:uncharacterized low-complexity protein
MGKRKIIGRSIVAATALTVSGITANASGLFNYNNLGTGENVRANLLGSNSENKNFELKCGNSGKTDSTMSKKGKDGKCGEGKCGANKKGKSDSTMSKKGKDGTCGANKKGM